MARVYLDHTSTTPLRPVAFEAMLPYLREHIADPGRVYHEGRTTRVAIEDAREQIAAFVGARPREVVFTSGGTESVVTALRGGFARGLDARGLDARGLDARGLDARGLGHVVTTAVEHSSVLETARALTGAELTVVGVDRSGRFDAAEVIDAIRHDTAIVSVQTANHEVGTLQPVAEVAAACRSRGVLVHIDACASLGQVALAFADLGADLCSIASHTLGGPKGVGAILVRRGLRIPPLMLGGAQERGRRAGIENLPAIAGFGAAVGELAATVSPSDGRNRLELEAARARDRTDRLARGALAVAGVERYGPNDPTGRLPNLVCLGIAGVEAEPILLGLDQHGVAVHSGSSCSSEVLEPSPVLAAMGVDADRSLRVSVGWSSVDSDIDRFLEAFPDVVDRLRSLRT